MSEHVERIAVLEAEVEKLQASQKEILADEAQLQDADGNVMTNAKDYVRTLP